VPYCNSHDTDNSTKVYQMLRIIASSFYYY